MFKLVIFSVIVVMFISRVAANIVCSSRPGLDIQLVGGGIALGLYLVLGVAHFKRKKAASRS
jgi:hypothetical protein